MPVLIRKTKDPHGWLGNMSPFPIVFADKEWRTTEALFQALRFDKPEIQEAIRAEKSPMSAKLVAKNREEEMSVVPKSAKDLENMELVLRLKLEQYPQLKKDLLATGEEPIIEDVSNRKGGRHRFWGAALIEDKWVGDNALGKIWMKLREELNASQALV